MARDIRSALRLTRLRLNNWRNFRAVDVHLERRAILIGPNAGGKSNFLDAVRFLAEVARPGQGGLQGALENPMRGGFSQVRCLHARNPPYVEIDATVGTDAEPQLWRYHVQFNRWKREKHPTVLLEVIYHRGSPLYERVRSEEDDPYEYMQTYLENVSFNKDFRDLTEFFSSCRYLHVVPQIVRDRRRGLVGDDPYGGDLLRRIKEMPKKTRLPRLSRISDALRIAVPQFETLELEDDEEGVPHLEAKYRHWRMNASRQSEAAFSDGTLRLIGLLWSISERGGPLLLEEPELSLNDSVVSQIPRMFTRMQKMSARQVIMTTHSSALLDDTDLGLKEVHIITVSENGSVIQNLADNLQINAQVLGGMTIAQAVLPLLRPRGVERLGQVELAL